MKVKRHRQKMMGNPTQAIPVINWTNPNINNHGQHKIGKSPGNIVFGIERRDCAD